QDVVGRTVGEYFGVDAPDVEPMAAHRAALKGESSVFELAWEGGHFRTYVEPLRGAGGEIEGTVGMALDITELRRAEQAQQSSENLYRQMFQTNQAVKLVLDPQTGQIIDANGAAIEYYGYGERLRQMNIADVNSLPRERIDEEMARAAREERSYFEFRHRLQSGALRDVEVHSSPLD